ncbi:hypothetical protein KM043_008662 [Ampulex compressa]|nr:hypothetical protein KM043_008662 [Ampulex compressa]
MVEFSEGSNLNSDDITRLVGDMNDLDNNLLNDSFKRQPSVPDNSKSSELSRDGRKRVLFKDYNEDDPLADLLSEDEEGENVNGNVLQERKSTITTAAKTNLMENLFGIKTAKIDEKQSPIPAARREDPKEARPLMKQESIWKTDSYISSNDTHTDKQVAKPKHPSNNDEDTLGNLLDKPRTGEDRSKKSLLMEDLFGSKPKSSPSKIATPSGLSAMNLPKPEQPVKPQMSTYVPPSSSVPKEPRRGRRTTIVNDPLGLLSPNPQSDQPLQLGIKESMPDTAKIKGKSITEENLPTWLDGGKKMDAEKEKEKAPLASGEESLTSQPPLIQQNVTVNDVYPEHLSTLMGMQFDQHATMMGMQQQEHELRTVAAFSQQNEQLRKILNSQQSKLSEQEKQFDTLIKMQMDRQAMLEAQMKIRQERIDRYIQVLMAQPTSVGHQTFGATSQVQHVAEKNEGLLKDGVESESMVQKLQLEKVRLEETIDSLKEKYENEITLQGESYRRQISFLEETMEKLEKRLKSELESQEMEYQTKIEKYKEQNMEMENFHKEEVHRLMKEHAQYVEEMYERHSQTIKLLEREHAETIERIAKAKETENLAVTALTVHKQDVENMLHKADSIVENIKSTYDKAIEREDESLKLRENYLQTQESEVKMQRQDLGKESEALARHREKLMEATEKFDIHIVRLMAELQKKNQDYDELQNILMKKEESLSRERELFEDKIQWERNYLQAWKDSWMKEQERQVKTLMEEKQLVAAERAKLETLGQLSSNTADIAKMESEATIKAAQDATMLANQERLKWQERVKELDAEKKVLEGKESQLVLRAKELENLTQSALAKREEGMRALREARHIENHYKEKLSDLQVQLEALAQREKKIATEKFNLARERLALQTNQAEKPERDIKIPDLHNFMDHQLLESEVHPTSKNTSIFSEVVDPELLMLRLSLDSQLDASKRYLTAMHS